MPSKQQIHISVDVGLVETLKEKGFNASAICNTALTNALSGYTPKTKQEIENLEWDLKQSKDHGQETLEMYNALAKEYNTLKATAKSALEELNKSLSEKDNQIQRLERESKQDKDKALKELESRLDSSYSEQIDGLQRDIADLNSVNKSEIDTLNNKIKAKDQELSDKDSALSAKDKDIFKINNQLTGKDNEIKAYKGTISDLNSRINSLEYDRSLSKYAPIFILAGAFAFIIFSGYGIYLLRTPISSFLFQSLPGFFNGIFTALSKAIPTIKV